MNKFLCFVLLLVLSLLWGCSTTQAKPTLVAYQDNGIQEEINQGVETMTADVLSVKVTGSPNGYQFAVKIASPDTGCDQYADWWEVVTENGQLVYRRILAHSHVSEQPFVRSGGPVDIDPDTVVVVRAHMNPGGYGGMVMKGSVQSGFEEEALTPDFAAAVESEPPQPDGCAF
jgi:hypothetical protein